MIKSLITAALLLAAAASTAAAATVTNVLQNINLMLTVYQQGATNSLGTKVSNKVSSFTTKNLIAALGTVAGQQFGTSAKLVLSTVYSNVTITTGPGVFSTNLSTNLALATNVYLSVGGVDFYGSNGDQGILTISNNSFITGGVGNIATNIVAVVGNTNESVTINTNVGFITTITPSTNAFGGVTNAAVLTLQQTAPPPTKSVLTNVSNSIDILGTANALYDVDNYLSFNINSPEIVVETGSGLNTTNALTVSNLISQTGVSIQGLQINYSMPAGPTNLTLTLTGFVKEALKVDVLSVPSIRGTNRAVADIFGASSTWNAVGSGYMGGAYTTNSSPNNIPLGGLGGYLTNASPIVVEGSVNVSFLKNLAQ